MPPRYRAVLAAALIGALAGCDDGSAIGGLGDFDPAPVEADLDAVLTPLRASIEPGSVLEDAFQALILGGVSFHRRPDARSVRGGLSPLATDPAATEFPPEILGSTYIYDTQQQGWRADSTRTGAPADGVRVIWYSTDPSGSLIVPLEERGYIDLSDEDTAELSRLGVLAVETSGDEDVVLTDFRQGYSGDGSAGTTRHAEADGFYADADVTVDFDLASDASGSQDMGDLTSALVVNLSGDPAAYTLDIDAAEVEGTEQVQQDVIASVVRDGVTTELALEFLLDGSEQSGSGTLSHAGEVIVDVAIDGNRFTYSDPDGRPLSSTDTAALDSLVRTLFLTGLNLLNVLPLLF